MMSAEVHPKSQTGICFIFRKYDLNQVPSCYGWVPQAPGDLLNQEETAVRAKQKILGAIWITSLRYKPWKV